MWLFIPKGTLPATPPPPQFSSWCKSLLQDITCLLMSHVRNWLRLESHSAFENSSRTLIQQNLQPHLLSLHCKIISGVFKQRRRRHRGKKTNATTASFTDQRALFPYLFCVYIHFCQKSGELGFWGCLKTLIESLCSTTLSLSLSSMSLWEIWRLELWNAFIFR